MSDKKTLFVTDLDGTLMRDDKTISDISIAILNRLISQPLYDRVKSIKGINCVFQQDKYRPEYWLWEKNCKLKQTNQFAVCRKQFYG